MFNFTKLVMSFKTHLKMKIKLKMKMMKERERKENKYEAVGEENLTT